MSSLHPDPENLGSLQCILKKFSKYLCFYRQSKFHCHFHAFPRGCAFDFYNNIECSLFTNCRAIDSNLHCNWLKAAWKFQSKGKLFIFFYNKLKEASSSIYKMDWGTHNCITRDYFIWNSNIIPEILVMPRWPPLPCRLLRILVYINPLIHLSKLATHCPKLRQSSSKNFVWHLILLFSQLIKGHLSLFLHPRVMFKFPNFRILRGIFLSKALETNISLLLLSIIFRGYWITIHSLAVRQSLSWPFNWPIIIVDCFWSELKSLRWMDRWFTIFSLNYFWITFQTLIGLST